MKLRDAGEYLLSAIFPERCIFCNAVIEPLQRACRTCRESIHVIKPPTCSYCGCSLEECHCQKHRHYYDEVIAPFYYKDAVRQGVLRLKIWDDPHALAYFSTQMCAALHRQYPDELPFDVVCYMPMTKTARYQRGYNQSRLLASEIAKTLQIPLCHSLIKLYDTVSQKGLKMWQRRGNMLGVFDVCEPVGGLHVLLVDDVLTTGASADECAKMLKIYGAETVTVATVSVVSFSDDNE